MEQILGHRISFIAIWYGMTFIEFLQISAGVWSTRLNSEITLFPNLCIIFSVIHVQPQQCCKTDNYSNM